MNSPPEAESEVYVPFTIAWADRADGLQAAVCDADRVGLQNAVPL